MKVIIEGFCDSFKIIHLNQSLLDQTSRSKCTQNKGKKYRSVLHELDITEHSGTEATVVQEQ